MYLCVSLVFTIYFLARPQAAPMVLCVPPGAPDLSVLLWVPPVGRALTLPRVLLVGLARSSESESSELLPRFEAAPLPRLLPTVDFAVGLFKTLAPRARPLPLETPADALLAPAATEGVAFSSESEESSMTILSGTFLLFVCVEGVAPRPLLVALVAAAAAAAAPPLFFGAGFAPVKSSSSSEFGTSSSSSENSESGCCCFLLAAAAAAAALFAPPARPRLAADAGCADAGMTSSSSSSSESEMT